MDLCVANHAFNLQICYAYRKNVEEKLSMYVLHDYVCWCIVENDLMLSKMGVVIVSKWKITSAILFCVWKWLMSYLEMLYFCYKLTKVNMYW